MRNLIASIFVLLALLPSTKADATLIIEFGDGANYWPGFSNAQTYPWIANNTDVWGTPDLLKGYFTLNDDNDLIEIGLTYKFPVKSGVNTFTLGDWFFGTGGVNQWDYVLSSPTNSNWTGLTGSTWNIYDVSGIEFETNYESGPTANYLYSDIKYGSGIERQLHPVKYNFTEDENEIGYATLIEGTWDTSINAGIEKTAVWDLSKNPLNLDLSKGGFYYGFAVTCANDVLYGDPPIPTPEPGSLLLLGAGLIGLGAVARRRRR